VDGLIADASLAPEGERKIAWVSEWMPVLNRVRDQLREEGSVSGRRIAVILPVEPGQASTWKPESIHHLMASACFPAG